MNYDLKMEEIIKNTSEGSSLLLHACCAPCSSTVLERLGNFFNITILYYNPNITDKDEYEKRLEEIKKFTSSFKTKYKIEVIAGRYEPREFFDIARGLENEPERGSRCYKCYKLRLEETAKVAKELNFDYFTTTLSLSPYKYAKWINEIGESLQETYNINFLYSDFKKKNGYKRSIELSHEFNLYRQDYCGCVYSVRDKIID
ncbi:MAG: epoxyqueuosine reductase QueH [Bacilli bacterium]|nr:epoxyqueuosine reductase QueH [Bacilli bacterium]